MTAYCPYNPAHIMPIDSLLKHLTRCTATNKHEFGQCKYNQLHVLPKEMLDKHHLGIAIYMQSVPITRRRT